MKKLILFGFVFSCFLGQKALFAQCGDTLSCLSTVNSFPYVEDFEGGKGGWYHGVITDTFPNPSQLSNPSPYFPGVAVGDSWAFGDPLKPHIVHAASGDSCWVVGGLTSNQKYLNQEHSFVASPCFDFTNLQFPFLSLKINYDIEYQFDGAAIQVSVDSGKSWTRLGSLGSGMEWYNNANLRSSPGRICAPANTEGWTGRSNGWRIAKHDLTPYAGLPDVRLRVIFASDPSTGKEGFAFDDVEILDAFGPGFLGADIYTCDTAIIGVPVQTFNQIFQIAGISTGWQDASVSSRYFITSSGQFFLFFQIGTQIYVDTINVYVSPPPSYTATVTDASCYNIWDGSIALNFPNPTPPSSYTFVWNEIYIGTNTVTGLSGGVNGRIVEITDSIGCYVRDTIYVNNPPPLLIDSIQTWPDFGSNDGGAKAFFRGSQGATSFNWGTLGGGQNTDSITNLAAGTDMLSITDANGCSDMSPYTIPYATGVYPGDTDHNQLVNMNDLLPIGLHYGKAGPLRPNATLLWTPQPAPLWGDTLANGKDLRHTDTDGNGSIDLNDTLAVSLNFGSTHNNQRASGRNQGPKLRFSMPGMNLNPGDTLVIPVSIGTVDTPIVNVYGMTFSIVYDSSLVEEGSAKLDFSGSWFGTKNINMIAMGRDAYPQERIHTGIVGFDSMQRSGYGKLFDLIVVLDDHIAKRQIPFLLGFADIHAIGLDGEPIELGGIPGEANISTALEDSWANEIRVYPQPAGDFVYVESDGYRLLGVEVFDLQGRCLGSAVGTAGEMWSAFGNASQRVRVEMAQLPVGVYMLRMETDRGFAWRKVCKSAD